MSLATATASAFEVRYLPGNELSAYECLIRCRRRFTSEAARGCFLMDLSAHSRVTVSSSFHKGSSCKLYSEFNLHVRSNLHNCKYVFLAFLVLSTRVEYGAEQNLLDVFAVYI